MNKPDKMTDTDRGTSLSAGHNKTTNNQSSDGIAQAAIDYDALKTSFISNISHEIRTPLNAILGFSELSLQNGADLKELLDYMKIIHNSSQELLQKIKDIIYVSTLDAGMETYKPETISMYGLMRDLHDYFQFVYRKQQNSKTEIRVHLENTNHFFFRSDAEKLVEVLKRLMDNGIKFTSEGTIELYFENSKPEIICFVVKDTGIGIPKDKLDVIFEPFATAQDLYSRNYNGSGLGLTIVRHLVAILEGQIEINSTMDMGTEVRVSIPYNPIHKS